jgi:hypothetical protein
MARSLLKPPMIYQRATLCKLHLHCAWLLDGNQELLSIAVRVGYLREADVRQAENLAAGIGKMLTALRNRLQNSGQRP